MIPSEISDFHSLSPENQVLISPNNFGLLQSDDFPNLHLNSLLGLLPNSYYFPSSAGHEFVPPSSNSTTSDEADEPQINIIDERKQRRMISNRESARRSRMRKQKHLDELWSQVVRLRNENHNLIDKLNHMTETHDKVLQENARLKEEAYGLRQMVAELKIESTPFGGTTMRDFDDVPFNTSQIRDDSPNQSVTSMEFLD